MAWQRNEIDAGSFLKARTGAIRSRSETRRGLLNSTSTSPEAPGTSPSSLVLHQGRFYSGSASTRLNGDPLAVPAVSSDGDRPVRTIRCGIGEGNLTRGGLVESRQNGRRSIPVKSGSLLALLCGNATRRLARDANSTAMTRRICRFISTISSRSPFATYDPLSAISFCYAKSVTILFIHGGM
jgi:hypothetical protein